MSEATKTAVTDPKPQSRDERKAAPDSLLAALFEGRMRADLAFPWPRPDAEETELFDVVNESVDRFLRERVDPAQIDRDGRIPAEVLDGLRELGLFGLIVPEEHGGLGFGQTAYTRLLAKVSTHCASTAVTLGAHSSIGLKALLLFGSDEQKARWLPELATGERIAAFCLTEAGSGSDAASIRTRAERRDDGWRLNGEKVWITNGGVAGLYTVFARTPAPDGWPKDKPHHACFLVPRELPGVSTGAEEDKLGLKGSSTTSVVLEDVCVPDDHRIGSDGDGFRIALEVLNSGRLGLAGACASTARHLLNLALEQAKKREQFGRPIASFGLIQQKLAWMAAEVYAMESAAFLVCGIVDRRSRGEHDCSSALESAACKIYCTERLWEIAHEALQIAGGNGFMREFPYERVLRDSRVNMIFEGTNEILRLMLALGGLKGVGKRVRRALKGMKKPGTLVPSLVDLFRFKFQPVAHFPCPTDDDEAREIWAQVDSCLRAVPQSARIAIATHREKLLEAQETLALVADIAQAGLVALACFTRCFGRDGSGEEDRVLCRDAVERQARRVRNLLHDLEQGPTEGQRPVVDWLLAETVHVPSAF